MERPGVPFEATNHRGLFTRAHAYDDGWSKRQVRRRLQSRRWKVVAGAALCDAATEIGAWELAHAVLLTWPDAVISHQLAGVLHGFPLDGPFVGTATVPLGRSRQAAGLRAHQIVLRPHDITRLGGLPVTAEGRTAVDLLGRLPWDQARSLFAWLTTRNRFSVQDLSAAVAQRKNMAGTTQLRRLVRVSASGSLSAAEDRLHETLRLGGLSGWKANAPSSSTEGSSRSPTCCSLRREWSSRWTDSPRTARARCSSGTARSRTSWWRPASWCCGSPGPTSSIDRSTS